jgi:putative salt-induced outer membrane protein YdiY
MPLQYRIGFVVIVAAVAHLVIAVPCVGKVNRHDTVVMKNGDRFTGEVKKLQQGVLYIETTYFSGSVGVDWLQVEKVESTATFQIVLSNGKRLTGAISKVKAESALVEDFKVIEASGEVPVSGSDVVEIEPHKQSFWRQLKGSIDLGYNYTSGNNQSSLSSSANTEYVAAHWSAGSSYNASYSGQSGGTTTNLFEVQTAGQRFLNQNSYLFGISDFLHSSQQDLNLRTTLGGGYGRYLFRNAHNELRWLAGADYTQASYQSGLAQPTQQNVEFIVGAQYQLFHFDRYSLQAQLLVFPGASDFGRVRMTTNDTFSVKLSNNFHLNFTFWDNFDSRPPPNAKRNAQGLSTSLGWKF